MKGFKRVLSENAINAAARQARGRIMRRVAEYLNKQTSPAALRRSIFHDIGDCVRINSRLEKR